MRGWVGKMIKCLITNHLDKLSANLVGLLYLHHKEKATFTPCSYLKGYSHTGQYLAVPSKKPCTHKFEGSFLLSEVVLVVLYSSSIYCFKSGVSHIVLRH